MVLFLNKQTPKRQAGTKKQQKKQKKKKQKNLVQKRLHPRNLLNFRANSYFVRDFGFFGNGNFIQLQKIQTQL